MSCIVYRISNLLRQILKSVSIGTNLGLFCLLWTTLTGSFLRYRGALTPSLASFGLSREQTRRSIAALSDGQWQIQDLVTDLQIFILKEGEWQPHRYDGYRPIPADLTAFYRPQLKDNAGKHFYAPAGKALPAITLGVYGAVGSLKGQRLVLLRGILKPEEEDPRDATLQKNLVKTASASLADKEVLVVDAGFSLGELFECECARFVVRLAKNDTARRNYLPVPKELGRPCEYGEKVRPLPKTYKGRAIPASAPDKTSSWEYKGRMIRAEIWKNLVGPDAKPGNATFHVIAIHDPKYEDPLLLASNLEADARVVWFLYKDRWAIEQVPLAGKKMLGGSASFVHSKQSRHRLPGLLLLAGSILSLIAASEEAIPTGYWDLQCQPTIGRLQRALSKVTFSDLPKGEEFSQIREKKSVHFHLLKGVSGHRRHKRLKLAEPARIAA